MTTDMAVTLAADTLEKLVVKGDLKDLTSAERLLYYRTLCDSVGLNPLTRPFEYLTLSGRLTLYARKDATDQLRNLHEVSITKLERETTEGVYCVTAYAMNAKGRTDAALGAVSIEGLRGEAKANALMKAETKAKRRVTLSLCGLGILDETEVETIPDAMAGEPKPKDAQRHVLTEPGSSATMEDVNTLLGRITAGFSKLKYSPVEQQAVWSEHCGEAPLLSAETDVAALAALLADLRARAKAAR